MEGLYYAGPLRAKQFQQDKLMVIGTMRRTAFSEEFRMGDWMVIKRAVPAWS
jgi:hypothetical protein